MRGETGFIRIDFGDRAFELYKDFSSALRLDGFTPAEIADQLGVGRVALRVRLARLRQRLKTSGVVTDWL